MSFFYLNMSFLLGIACISFSLIFFNCKEFYPFYQWNMFNRPETVLNDFSITIHSLDGKTQELDLYENQKTYLSYTNRKFYFIIQKMGWSWFDGPREFEKKESNMMNSIFYSKNTIEYSLFKRTFNTLSLLKNPFPDLKTKVTSRFCAKNGNIIHCENSKIKGNK